MDDKNINKKNEEDLSLDDMMAQAVENSEEPKGDDEVKEESLEAPEENSEESTDTKEQEDSETSETVEEATENTSDENSTETSEDMVEEVNKEEQDSQDTKAQAEETPAPAPAIKPKEYKGKWYIVHTYSGHENKVAKTLMQRVQAMGFENNIFDALVPTRDTIRVRGGKKEAIKEKIFPGYILVNMELSDEAWVLVRTTPGVTSFVGAQNKPTPIRDDEVQAIVAFVGQKDPVYKAQFSTGEAVKITDGPFSDFLGTVESIDEAKGKIKVLVSIFGRETPVELDFLQVAKI